MERKEEPWSTATLRLAPSRFPKVNDIMFDLLCLVLIVFFFVVAAAYARGCERLQREDD